MTGHITQCVDRYLELAKITAALRFTFETTVVLALDCTTLFAVVILTLFISSSPQRFQAQELLGPHLATLLVRILA